MLRTMRLARGWRTLLPGAATAGGARADRWLLAITVVLVGLGIVMIYSASAIRAQERFGDPTFFLKKQAVWAALGLLAMVWAVTWDLKRFRRATPILFLVSLLLLLLVLVPGIGIKINGARRWLRLFGLSFQPAELAKLAAVLFLASYFARRQDRLDSFLDGCLRLLDSMLPARSLSSQTSARRLSSSAVVMFTWECAHWSPSATVAAGAPGLLFLMWMAPHGRARLMALWNPSQVSAQATYQLDQSFYALGPGGWLGLGLGNSMQKLFFLPTHNDHFRHRRRSFGRLGRRGVVCAVPVARRANGNSGVGPLCWVPGHGRDQPDRRPGGDQHGGRERPAAHDGRAAPLPELRRVLAGHYAVCGGAPPQRVAESRVTLRGMQNGQRTMRIRSRPPLGRLSVFRQFFIPRGIGALGARQCGS
jgi:cell division protein FtsW